VASAAQRPTVHLRTANDGALRPLMDGVAVNGECGQLWVRRDARQAWRLEFLLDRVSTDDERVFKRDESVRLPWDKAAHSIGGVWHLRPEIALLFKAKLAREKDRADLLAARLEPAARAWLVQTLKALGHDDLARLARMGRAEPTEPSTRSGRLAEDKAQLAW
jgi:hypothetical protein